MSKAVIVCGPRWWGQPSMLRDRSLVDYDNKKLARARAAEAELEMKALRDALDLLPEGTLVMHGAAHGLDTEAAILSQSLGLPVAAVPYFSHLGEAGGPARNRAMVAMLLGLHIHEGWKVKMLVFLPEPAPSVGGVTPRFAGTVGMMEEAEKWNIWITTVRPDAGEIAAPSVDTP